MNEQERENFLLYGDKNGPPKTTNVYQGQDLVYKTTNRRGGDDEDQDLTESEYLVKTMQEVRKFSDKF